MIVGMATRLSRSEQVERNRGLVLAAARQVFLAKGYGGATVDAIADEAGFSKGVVYSQFASKGALFLALLEQRISERARENAAIAAEADGVLALLHANARRSEEDPDWGRLLIEFRVFAARDEELNARYADLHARTVAGFAAALEHVSERSGEVLPQPTGVVAAFILALDNGTTLERTAAPEALPQPYMDDLITSALGLRARDVSTRE